MIKLYVTSGAARFFGNWHNHNGHPPMKETVNLKNNTIINLISYYLAE
jgi:hypothetical protein